MDETLASSSIHNISMYRRSYVRYTQGKNLLPTRYNPRSLWTPDGAIAKYDLDYPDREKRLLHFDEYSANNVKSHLAQWLDLTVVQL